MGETVFEKLDELRDFLDVFLTIEECILVRETDDIVKNKRFSELKSIDGWKNFCKRVFPILLYPQKVRVQPHNTVVPF